MRYRALLAALALTAAATTAQAQSFSQLAPATGVPGDTIAVHGINLDTVTAVRFTANVGGFVGVISKDAPATVVSSELLLVDVPQINSFIPPGTPQGGSVSGFCELVTPAGVQHAITFFYLEATFGQTLTYGQGGCEAGSGDPRIGFRLQFGLPTAGNLQFDARAYGLPAGAQGFLYVGLPAAQPFLPFGGGELLLDTGGPLIVVPGAIPATPIVGETFAKLPIPDAALGATVGLQWVAIDASTFTLCVTNGLEATL